MDSNNWRSAAPQGDAPMETVDWRTGLQPDSRQQIVDKIMETLKKHFPFFDQDGLQKLRDFAVRFEEKMYTSAISQVDYLRKTTLKMLSLENISQNSVQNFLLATISGGNRLTDSGGYFTQDENLSFKFVKQCGIRD